MLRPNVIDFSPAAPSFCAYTSSASGVRDTVSFSKLAAQPEAVPIAEDHKIRSTQLPTVGLFSAVAVGRTYVLKLTSTGLSAVLNDSVPRAVPVAAHAASDPASLTPTSCVAASCENE